jgi:transcriptional regulator with XRE-family HTH domain
MIFPLTALYAFTIPMSNTFSDNLEYISAEARSILFSSSLEVKKQLLKEWVRRKLAETGYTHAMVSERARRQGYVISTGYVNNLAQGDADNPSPKLIKAIAAGFGVSVWEVIYVIFGNPPEGEPQYPEIETLRTAYKSLPPDIQRQKKQLIEMLIREIQREL